MVYVRVKAWKTLSSRFGGYVKRFKARYFTYSFTLNQGQRLFEPKEINNFKWMPVIALKNCGGFKCSVGAIRALWRQQPGLELA